MTKESELIEQIVGRYDVDTGMLIPILQDLQADCGYLPQEHLLCLEVAEGAPQPVEILLGVEDGEVSIPAELSCAVEDAGLPPHQERLDPASLES